MKKSFKSLLKACFSGLMASALVAGASLPMVHAQDVTLSYASWDKDQAVGLRKVLDAFEAANPGIKVEMETSPWDQYWTKMEAAATGGNLPDIVTMHSAESYKYMSNNMLMNLDEIIAQNNIDMSTFAAGIEDFYKYEGSTYAIPKDASVVALWYNKKLFDEAGLDYPNADWTWDDLLEAAKALTNPDTGVYGFGVSNNNEVGFWPFLFQAGGTVYSEDGSKSTYNTPEVIEALQFYADMINVHKVSPAATVMQETPKSALFQAGKLAMIIEGNWHTAPFIANDYTRENAAVAVLPKGPKQQATVVNGLGWAVSAQTKHPEEAAKLIAFLASDEANKIQAETGVSIPAKNGYADEYINSMDAFDLSAFEEMLAYGVARPYIPQALNAEAIESEVLDLVLSGQKTPAEGAAEIEARVNALLGN